MGFYSPKETEKQKRFYSSIRNNTECRREDNESTWNHIEAEREKRYRGEQRGV